MNSTSHNSSTLSSRGFSFAIVIAIYIIAGLLFLLVYRWLDRASFTPLLSLFVADVVATIFVWLCGVVYKNVSVYDPYWSIAPPLMLTFWMSIAGFNTPYILLLVAVWLWAIRLTGNWAYTFRSLQTEDWRYTRYRQNYSPFIFQLINLFGLNMVPTLQVFVAMLPALLLPAKAAEANLLSWVALAVCLGAVAIELIADMQRHRFVRQRTSRDEILQTGLWRHGRHPNYFGEISFWWGVWLMYVSVYGFASRPWLIVAPVSMTALFLFISIPMMERRQLQNKPAYADYRRHTRKLI